MSRFIMEQMEPGAKIYTDDALTYHALPNHETVRHSVGEYVRGKAHTNGVESFWSMLKRAHMGTFHKMSPKHLHQYVNEFSGRHNIREADTGRPDGNGRCRDDRQAHQVPGTYCRQRTGQWSQTSSGLT